MILAHGLIKNPCKIVKKKEIRYADKTTRNRQVRQMPRNYTEFTEYNPLNQKEISDRNGHRRNRY